MSKPGAGRYTAYIPPAGSDSNKNYAKRYALFNGNSTAKGGDFISKISSDADAAAEILALATKPGKGLLPTDGVVNGNDMFSKQNLNYASHPNVPNTSDTNGVENAEVITIHGGAPLTVDLPWTNYVPNISSPGAKDEVPNLSSADKKPATADQKASFKRNSGLDPLPVASPSVESSNTKFTLGEALKLGSKAS